jgi:uncharacterized YigZ family protein
MNNKDYYYTIAKPFRAEQKIKGSKFIASVASVSTRDEALLFLEQIRSEFFDATHNCFAYRLGPNGLEYRAADDGEPSGSAGKPILFAITKFELSDIIVVVTRYFGGTKLGVGGLARAYSSTAELALSQCERKAIHITAPVKVLCTYEDVSTIKKLIDEYAVGFSEQYSDAVEFIVDLHLSKIDEFQSKVVANTNGRAGVIHIK